MVPQCGSVCNLLCATVAHHWACLGDDWKFIFFDERRPAMFWRFCYSIIVYECHDLLTPFRSVCSLTTRKAAWDIISVVSVCLSVYQTITFESLDVQQVHFRTFTISPVNTGRVRIWRSSIKVTWTKKGQKFLCAQCKTSIGNNSGSIKHRAMKFACSIGFLVRWIKWRDRHLCHVT